MVFVSQIIPEEYKPYGWAAAILLAAWIVWRVRKAYLRFRRRRMPATLHPKLQKYGVDTELLAQQRREAAMKIVATSSGEKLVGYEITEQIDAVFVEGFRTPAEAVEGLKAEAANRGANAVINVRQERTMAGKCSASGDAVRANRIAGKE